MKIMFVGIGLIGGSMALALKDYPDAELYGVDRDGQTRLDALSCGAVRDCWADAQAAPLESMDVLVICLPPEAAADFIRRQAHRLKAGALLTDVCGVKRPLYQAVESIENRAFTYLGGHPMAGKECGGFASASADLFRGSHYILTPDDTVSEDAVRLMERLTAHMGCADIVYATPQEHDERIGYTSQLMHVMALALCDQHLLFDSCGFEGGSFRGATRVAALDAGLWTELMWANRDTLADLVDELQEKMDEYSALLRGDDRGALHKRLEASSGRKKEFDRRHGGAQSLKPLPG